MHQIRLWAGVVEPRLIHIIVLVSVILAACNNGGKGPGY
jgi:hypothetical protein